MKKLIPYLLSISIAFVAGCSKNNTDNTPTATHASLIAGVYTATKTEGSNNNTDWTDFTKAAAHEVLTLSADHNFNSVLVNNGSTTGALNLPAIGTWALSADGNTLSYVNIQDYTIVTLTSTSMVTTTKGPMQKVYVDAPQYTYYRFTYTRTNN